MPKLFEPTGGATKTTTQVNQVPQFVQDFQGKALDTAGSTLNPLISTPGYTSAGVNADQSGAYDLTRYLAQGAFSGGSPSMPAWYQGGQSAAAPAAAQPYQNYTGGMSPAATYYSSAYANPTGYASAGYNPANATAAQITGSMIQGMMNPYTQSVIDPTLAQMRQGHDATSAQIGAQSAAAGSFGGSREALRQGQNDRALGEQTALTTAQMNNQAYQQASALAQQNAQMWQQASLQNAAAQNAAAQFGAAAQNTAGQFGANAQNTASLANQSAFNQVASNNVSAQNSRDQFLASLGLQGRSQDLSAAQIQDGLASSDQARKLQAIQALLGIGNAEQQMVQSNLNQPMDFLKLLLAAQPQNYGGTSTSTAPNTANSPFMNLLGLGTSILGMKTGGDSTVLGNLIK